MYDKLLAKEEFVKKLTAVGYTSEETESLWVDLGKIFEIKLFRNACETMTDEKLVEITGKQKLTKDDIDEAMTKIGSYIKSHPGEFDMNSLVRDSAMQAIDQMGNFLEGGK